jgi:hypothetical protein
LPYLVRYRVRRWALRQKTLCFLRTLLRSTGLGGNDYPRIGRYPAFLHHKNRRHGVRDKPCRCAAQKEVPERIDAGGASNDVVSTFHLRGFYDHGDGVAFVYHDPRHNIASVADFSLQQAMGSAPRNLGRRLFQIVTRDVCNINRVYESQPSSGPK